MELLQHLIIKPGATIRDAMQAIDRGSAEIALLVDDARTLLGTVSDGDVRRALLGGSQLDDPVAPVAAAQPRTVGPGASRAEVLDLMRAWTITQLPIVTDGRLVGMHLMRDVLGATSRPNWAVVMAGGRGTRLAPFTDTLPKPMLRIAGRPILERIVLHLVGCGIRRVFLSINYLGEVIEEHFGDGGEHGCEIEYLREVPGRGLGTCGSVRLMLEAGNVPTVPLIVMNGDLVTDFSLHAFLHSHEESGAVASVAVQDYAHTVPFGVAETVGNRLVRMDEKPTHSWLVNAGTYVLEPRILDRIPADVEYHVPDLINDCLARGEVVSTWYSDAEWQDIGRLGELRRAVGIQ